MDGSSDHSFALFLPFFQSSESIFSLLSTQFAYVLSAIISALARNGAINLYLIQDINWLGLLTIAQGHLVVSRVRLYVQSTLRAFAVPPNICRPIAKQEMMHSRFLPFLLHHPHLNNHLFPSPPLTVLARTVLLCGYGNRMESLNSHLEENRAAARKEEREAAFPWKKKKKMRKWCLGTLNRIRRRKRRRCGDMRVRYEQEAQTLHFRAYFLYLRWRSEEDDFNILFGIRGWLALVPEGLSWQIIL